jgi:hypothetical protein
MGRSSWFHNQAYEEGEGGRMRSAAVGLLVNQGRTTSLVIPLGFTTKPTFRKRSFLRKSDTVSARIRRLWKNRDISRASLRRNTKARLGCTGQ